MKYEKDGKVAILYSPYQGWFTQFGRWDLVFDPKVCELVERREKLMETISYRSTKIEDLNKEIRKWLEEKYDLNYYLPVPDLCIRWLEVGEKFRIIKLGDKEVVELLVETQWMEA